MLCEICKKKNVEVKIVLDGELLSICEDCNWDTTDITLMREFEKIIQNIYDQEKDRNVKN